MNGFITAYDDQGVGVFAKPMATEKLLKKICKLTKEGMGDREKHIVMSPKMVSKVIHKKAFQKGIVVMSASAPHLDMIAAVPIICEENKVPYIWVPNKAALVQGGSGFGWRMCSSCFMIKRDNLDAKWQGKFDELAKKIKKAMPTFA